MSIGYSPNSPKSKNIKDLENISFEELIPKLKNIKIGDKDGSFFIRSAFLDPSTGKKTNDSVEPSAQILVIDADSSVDLETGEITEGAPDPKLIAAVLVVAGWNFLLYRSHSHGTKGHRYRIVMWTDRPYTQDELGPTLDSVIFELHDAGLNLRNAPENNNWSLAWYLPRRDANDNNAFTFLENTKGGPVQVIKADVIPENIQSAMHSAHDKRSNPLGNGLIRIYNNLYPLRELLKQRGDIEKGYNRFIYSKSSSGTAGIVIFDDLMYSHHADDPLADGEAHDSFDVYRISNNKSLSQGLSSLTYQEIIDYIDNENDEDILSDINRGLVFASPQVQAKVRKVLKQRLELNMSTLKDEAKHFKRSLDEENDEEELESHIDIVADFLTQFETKPISYAGQLYTYNGTIWEAQEVKSYQTLFAERYKTNPLCKRTQDYNNLAQLLYTACIQVKDFFQGSPRGIAVNRRFLTVDHESGDVLNEVLTHDHRQRIHYDLELDQESPELWLQTLNKALNNQDEIELLQEIFAATLFGMFPGLKKAALLKGTGDSGKSTLLEVLQGFIPEPLRSASPPSDWGNKEYIGNIAGKALNSVGEMDAKKKMSGNDFKKVIGNDICEGRKLYIGVFNFANTSAHIFNANEFPPTSATDPAFFSRWVIVNFPNEIPEADRIENFATKILSAEKARILNWILEGAQRLIVNKKFTRPENHNKLIKTWESTVNPFLAFIQDDNHVIIVENPMGIPANERKYYTSEQIYKVYELWCRVNNIRSTFAISKLIQKMKEHHILFRNPDNNNAKLYTGVKFNLNFNYTSKVSLFDLDDIYEQDYKGNRA